MRIVIDMQGAQAENRRRGIGKYSISITKQILKDLDGNDIFLFLNGLFTESILEIRNEFKNLIPNNKIKIWHPPFNLSFLEHGHTYQREICEIQRENFIYNLNPSIILNTSVFEGLVDGAIVSVGQEINRIPTAAIIYDLIPLVRQVPYLENPKVKKWYYNQLKYIKKASLLLAISEATRQEAIVNLGFDKNKIINISSAVDVDFKKISLSIHDIKNLKKKYDIKNNFIMYTGGIDHRKNIDLLIKAYAAISEYLRNQCQLVIVCSVQDDEKHRLENLAFESGLKEKDLILTGYVPQKDLIALYNLCKGFVFPSLHEGFGLPVLEAMSCGKAVIASNVSSLPEVVGCDEALFDPQSRLQMCKKLTQLIADEKFRCRLEEHSQNQANKFSWEKTASIALKSLIKEDISQSAKTVDSKVGKKLNKLAYISPFPPLKTGIADYSAELVPYLSEYYEIDIIVDQPNVCFNNKNLRIVNLNDFLNNHKYYDRIIYHFGNSQYHKHMFDLLEITSGVVVLHDFYLSGVVSYLECNLGKLGFWSNEIYKSHGYAGLIERYENSTQAIWKYPCNLSILQNSIGIITHSNYSKKLSLDWYGISNEAWKVIPLLRESANLNNKIAARNDLNIHPDSFIICSFGAIGKNKINHRLLKAWINSTLADDRNSFLYFVGESHDQEYFQGLLSLAKNHKLEKNIHFVGWTDAHSYRLYLTAADAAVQLRSLSRGETSAAVLDCMNFGLPTVVNSNGSMGDLDENCVLKIPDNFSEEELVGSLEILKNNLSFTSQIAKSAKDKILKEHSPQYCAEKYHNAIECFYNQANTGVMGASASIIEHAHKLSADDLSSISVSLSQNYPRLNIKTIFVDISELVQRDSKTGIQRVVRSILLHWITKGHVGFRVEPVYAQLGKSGYRYARKFTCNLLNISAIDAEDDLIEYCSGDIFIGLDLQHHIVNEQKENYRKYVANGMNVYFVIYDLLPILQSQYFVKVGKQLHENWINTISEFSGAFCISNAVADELHAWISDNISERIERFKIDWFHLGADLKMSIPSLGLPPNYKEVLNSLSNIFTFLMVGTIEPRKAHAQVLEAFEALWRDGVDVNLVIVGKQGWMVDELCEKLRHHPELNNRLFWLEGINDEYLEKVYASSTCLIAASYGEGFGLPLIESAQHGLPILARDIPVFREVAGEHAAYFKAETPEELAVAIKSWLAEHQKNTHPKSSGMNYLTWKESAAMLLEKICQGETANDSQKTEPLTCPS